MAHKTIMQRLAPCVWGGRMARGGEGVGCSPWGPGLISGGTSGSERPGRQSVQSHGENRAGR